MAETPTWKRDILVLLAALGEEHGAHKELDLRVALRDDGGQRPLEEVAAPALALIRQYQTSGVKNRISTIPRGACF